jgi:hypothetical protein
MPMDKKLISKLSRSSKFLVNRLGLLASKKPHIICEVLVATQLKLLVAEKKINQKELGSIEVSIKSINMATALLQKYENHEIKT